MTAAVLHTETARHQRADGTGEVVMGRTLRRLYQEGCAQARLPRNSGGGAATAVLINMAGGLTGGDRLRWRATAEAGGSLTVTSQACERIYRSLGDEAEVAVSLKAEAGAYLAWLPQETLLYDGGRLSRRLDAEIAADARLLVCEAVILGRAAMGEAVRTGTLRDRWRIRRDGRLVFAEDLRLEGDICALASRAAALAGSRAFASFLLISPDAEAGLEAVRETLGQAGGASAWDGKLFGRVLASDGLTLRRVLLPALQRLNGAPLPRVWSL